MWGKYSYIISNNFSTGYTKCQREKTFLNLKGVLGIMKPKKGLVPLKRPVVFLSMTILLPFPALSTSSAPGNSEKLNSSLLVISLKICCETGINMHTLFGTFTQFEK